MKNLLGIYLGIVTQGKGIFSPRLLNNFVPSGRAEGDGGTSGTYSSLLVQRPHLWYDCWNDVRCSTYDGAHNIRGC